jgi:hypothetical protein
MEYQMNTFSKRNGYAVSEEVEITVREDAPNGLRNFIIDVAEDDCGLNPSDLRQIICRILKESPNPNNWSDYPNVDNEIRELIARCKWYKVYDIIEKLYLSLYENEKRQYKIAIKKADTFQNEINDYFLEKGIGWKLVDGQIEMRGTEPFEKIMKSAHEQLESTEQYSTASKELHEAIIDLSRRPSADTTGAIQHAIASLECVAREITGERTLTLGKIMERKKITIPRPLDSAIEKAWGYASEHGRHLQEGRNPGFEEAELIVGICSSVGNYLVKKSKTELD